MVLAGNVIADLVIEVPALPERGGDVLGSRTELTAGGGFNTLTAARRLGLPGLYAGGHGTGPYGDLVRAALADADLPALLPARTDGDSGFCVALVDDGGERTFVTSLGVDARLTPAEADRIAAALRPGDLVQISGYGLVMPVNGPFLVELVRGAPAGVVVCLDPAPLVADIPVDRWEAVLARTDWLSCNAREARLSTGLTDPGAAARALRERLPAGAGVVVRTGAQGCVVAAPGAGAPEHVPGFPVVAVDVNGAGDTHVGAFLALLAAGAPPVLAARGANAAAACAVTRRGPATGPGTAELLAFLAEDPVAEPLRAALAGLAGGGSPGR
ncbi:PfkB family carbohydrate kinase [Streptomyces sp. BI20]|uniref:PfkB family carbohydrate kinase n=1 Tax=Streptomyces sp. BI20 TaxID=3403460 RepID=UPI003C743076